MVTIPIILILAIQLLLIIFSPKETIFLEAVGQQKNSCLKINSIHILVGRQELDSPCPSWQGQIYILRSKSLETALTFYVTFILL